MFGYVTVHKPELKMKDFTKYKGYYCGLCRTLREKYGVTGQMTLTYDMTFAIILLTSLYESQIKVSNRRCMAHPMKKQLMLQNEITEYAAAMNVILAYYHMKDNWEDEKSLSGLASATLLHPKIRDIELQYPRQCQAIRKSLDDLGKLEKDNSDDLDAVAGCFGMLMSELFIYREDEWQENLRKIGFYMGKFIYLMDAFDDVEKDLKEDNYNPLKEQFQNEQFDEKEFQETCGDYLVMMMSECSNEFEKLPCIVDVDILRNILYDGVWTRYNNKINKEKNIDAMNLKEK